MKVRNIIGLVAIASLLFSACATQNQVNKSEVVNTSTNWQSKASAKVKDLLQKGNFEVVDTTYVKSRLGKGIRVSAKAIIVDTRPIKKYAKGHVPTAYIVPDTAFEKFYPAIESLDKNNEIITYCGGWKCAKSSKVALMLKEKGWKNVKVYQEGMPAWNKSANYNEISLAVVKSAVKKQNALIIDARPAKVFNKGRIPTSINIPDRKFNDYISSLPADKSEKIIVYCGGFKCAKSHNVAKELKKLGYKKVFVYSAGLPQWKKKGLEIEKSSKKAIKKIANANFIIVNGVQLVKEQEDNAGMVYGDFFKKVVNGEINEVQIVDVRDADDFKDGHIKGAINISFEDIKEKEFVSKVMQIVKGGKKVIFVCVSGASATEAMTIVQENGGDTRSIFFADAAIDCNKSGKCIIEINEPL